MFRRFVPLLALPMTLLGAGCRDYDLADRRIAAIDDYRLRQQRCEVDGDEAVATGQLTNLSGTPNGFAVIVRFLDGEVDLGRPQTVEHVDHLDDGESWAWEVSLALDDDPDVTGDRLDCTIVQVVIGQAV